MVHTGAPETDAAERRTNHAISGARPNANGALGLTATEAAQRLAHEGPNELPERKESPLRKLLPYLLGPIPSMIEIAAVLSALISHWVDFGVIVMLLAVNATIGFYEEHAAGSAISALRERLALRARVRRDGAWKTMPARELVVGDLIRVRLGDIVPADAKLSDGTLELDQSTLTGESLPVSKEAGEPIWSGTTVQRGEADALVYATGEATEMGRTVALTQERAAPSHYQQAVIRIGEGLIVAALLLVTVVVAVELLRGANALDTLAFALVLTVAAIPVAMPAVLSVTMAVGALVLAGRKAIVSRLVAVEEMAGMDVLCSDKTGTLTKNELAIGEPICFGGATALQTLEEAALASRAEDGDPIDTAVLTAAPPAAPGRRVVKLTPFDPVSKRAIADVVEDGPEEDRVRFQVAKGAPQAIAELCDLQAPDSKALGEAVSSFASHGFRPLAVASTDSSGKWRLLGVLPLSDPPREDSAETLAAAKRLGVKVKMMTGDHTAIAREIARQIGLGEQIRPASETLSSTGQDVEQVDVQQLDVEEVEQLDGFAEVFPGHKHAIVAALQDAGHLVGMTGDGVNDAPALKRADVGIAVDGATDAARAAADLVLTAPGLSVIIGAIEESRRVFRRMTSYAIFRIAETTRVLVFAAIFILAYGGFPVTAAMIVILALINDLPIMMIAYDHERPSPKPARWRMQMILALAATLGLTGVAFTFGLYWIGSDVLGLATGALQTLIFLKLAVAGHMTIYLARTRERPFWARPYPSPALFIATETTQVLATAFAVFGWLVPALGIWPSLLVWGYALVELLVLDRVKLATYRAMTSVSSRLADSPSPVESPRSGDQSQRSGDQSRRSDDRSRRSGSPART